MEVLDDEEIEQSPLDEETRNVPRDDNTPAMILREESFTVFMMRSPEFAVGV